MNPLRFPISSQPFEDIRKRGLTYIDKTDLVYELTHSDIDYVFLSRPRRFGKSLLVSTLKSYFEGLPIVKVGVNFSSETRTINEWVIE